jgi:hypothetical protein
MAKLYDIVDTSKMSCEYDGSLINVECVASTALENGRALVVDYVNKTCAYPTDITKPMVLHANIEKMYKESLGLTEYRTEAGEYVRFVQERVTDEFTTSGIDYSAGTGNRTDYASIVVGDQVVVHAGDGKFTCQARGTSTTSSLKGIVLEKTTVGYDRLPAIVVKVVAC